MLFRILLNAWCLFSGLSLLNLYFYFLKCKRPNFSASADVRCVFNYIALYQMLVYIVTVFELGPVITLRYKENESYHKVSTSIC